MRDLLRTSDPVLVTFVEALLGDAGIGFHSADTHISAMEGSIGAFPRRIQVADADVVAARQLLTDAGLGRELVDDPTILRTRPDSS